MRVALQGCNDKKQPLIEKPVKVSQTYFLRVFCFMHLKLLTVDSE